MRLEERMTGLKYREEWNGEHHGVAIEIMRWQLGGRECWNYYILLPLEQIPETARSVFNLRGKSMQFSPDGRKHMTYEYASAPIIGDLDWHGGITFYEKHRDAWGKVDGIKIGCDYAHLWDEDSSYDLSSVEAEARHSVDRLLERVPNMRLRCTWDGKYYPADEGSPNHNGNFVADVNKHKGTGSQRD